MKKPTKNLFEDSCEQCSTNTVPIALRDSSRPQMARRQLRNRRGAQNIGGLLTAIVAALPDVKATEQAMIVEGDTVAVRLVVEGTHKGNLLGFPATNRHVRRDAIDMYKITNGKIVDDWASEDGVKILADVGAYTLP